MGMDVDRANPFGCLTASFTFSMKVFICGLDITEIRGPIWMVARFMPSGPGVPFYRSYCEVPALTTTASFLNITFMLDTAAGGLHTTLLLNTVTGRCHTKLLLESTA
ncbi:hypothetical protein MHYP_G00299310 [Metynnis hypsauchen]